ncbi:hypothetical protein E2C01_100537 [Portunus trituberculatus]|uniref:Uncharacterized protein n=1 Tax=Portunus trituberculatus TaxID=210409 RepID=A0A5B7KDB3_PORTR|nr:hypothetical protein [Portunus trituberculatus]
MALSRAKKDERCQEKSPFFGGAQSEAGGQTALTGRPGVVFARCLDPRPLTELAPSTCHHPPGPDRTQELPTRTPPGFTRSSELT